MRELEKVVNVVRKRSKLPVYTVLVIDATTGQNGLQQAREFNRALDLDALIVTKLDGTAKGGIALAVSHDLELPIVKIGVGEGIDDLRDFNAREFAAALVGAFDERFDEDEDSLRGENAKEAAVTAGERRRDVLEGAPAATAEVEVAAEAGEDVADAEPAADAEAGGAAADAEAAAPAGIAEAGAAGEPVIDEQGDVEEALVEAAEEMVVEPADGDLVEAALGRRTHETIVAEVADEPADEEGDGAPFTDDELAELALTADGDGEGAEEAGEPEPAPEPEKKSFWKRLFD